jgi:hypothetical protein
MTGTRALVEVAVLNDVTLAEIMRGALQADGIEARLFDAGVSGLLGGGYPGIRLMVPERDADRARTRLDLPTE